MKILLALAAVAACLLVVLPTFAVAGVPGLLLLALILWATLLMARRSTIPQRQRPARMRAGVEHLTTGFPSYRAIENKLSSGVHSPRMFDYALRPKLAQITFAVLLDRTGTDAESSPDTAAKLLGANAWSLVDPSRIPSEDSEAPGVPAARIDALMDRLEEL